MSELSGRLAPTRDVGRRQTNYLPVRMIMVFEQYVADVSQSDYSRCYAWLRPLKYRASLRFDDLKWVNPKRVVLPALGLRMDLERTQVSGPGKRTVTLVAYVSGEAYCPGPGLAEDRVQPQEGPLRQRPAHVPPPYG